jgi:ribosomal protein S18 acetylase RimI-like enzyme
MERRMHNKRQISCQIILKDLQRKWHASRLMEEVELTKKRQKTRWLMDKF